MLYQKVSVPSNHNCVKTTNSGCASLSYASPKALRTASLVPVLSIHCCKLGYLDISSSVIPQNR